MNDNDSRTKYLERHRRYNASEKGRARYARSNAKRIFVGRYYAGREHHYPVARGVVEARLRRLYDVHLAKQALELEHFRSQLA